MYAVYLSKSTVCIQTYICQLKNSVTVNNGYDFGAKSKTLYRIVKFENLVSTPRLNQNALKKDEITFFCSSL